MTFFRKQNNNSFASLWQQRKMAWKPSKIKKKHFSNKNVSFKKKKNNKLFQIKKFLGLKKFNKKKWVSNKQKLLKLIHYYRVRNLQKKKFRLKVKKRFKHKYKKPYYKRKYFKKIQTFLYLSYNDLNSFFIIPKHFRITRISYLRRIKVWKYLYKEYLQYYFGIPKKIFSKVLKTYINKKKGLFGIFKLLTKKLNFFFIFNLIKYYSNKNFKFKILYYNLIYNINCKTRLDYFYNKNYLLMLYPKYFFKIIINLKIKKLRYWFFKKYYKFRLWQRKSLKIYFKILNFFYFINLKRYWVNTLYYNKFFFLTTFKDSWIYSLYFNNLSSGKKNVFYNFFFLKKKNLKKYYKNFNIINFFFFRKRTLFFFYKFKVLWRRKHLKFFKLLQKKIKKILKVYKDYPKFFFKKKKYFFCFFSKAFHLNKISSKVFLFKNRISFKLFSLLWLRKKIKNIFFCLPYFFRSKNRAKAVKILINNTIIHKKSAVTKNLKKKIFKKYINIDSIIFQKKLVKRYIINRRSLKKKRLSQRKLNKILFRRLPVVHSLFLKTFNFLRFINLPSIQLQRFFSKKKKLLFSSWSRIVFYKKFKNSRNSFLKRRWNLLRNELTRVFLKKRVPLRSKNKFLKIRYKKILYTKKAVVSLKKRYNRDFKKYKFYPRFFDLRIKYKLTKDIKVNSNLKKYKLPSWFLKLNIKSKRNTKVCKKSLKQFYQKGLISTQFIQYLINNKFLKKKHFTFRTNFKKQKKINLQFFVLKKKKFSKKNIINLESKRYIFCSYFKQYLRYNLFKKKKKFKYSIKTFSKKNNIIPRNLYVKQNFYIQPNKKQKNLKFFNNKLSTKTEFYLKKKTGNTTQNWAWKKKLEVPLKTSFYRSKKKV